SAVASIFSAANPPSTPTTAPTLTDADLGVLGGFAAEKIDATADPAQVRVRQGRSGRGPVLGQESRRGEEQRRKRDHRNLLFRRSRLGQDPLLVVLLAAVIRELLHVELLEGDERPLGHPLVQNPVRGLRRAVLQEAVGGLLPLLLELPVEALHRAP